MITIKLPYRSTDKYYAVLHQLRKEYSSVVRYSYNRYLDDIKQIDIRHSLSQLNNINHLNSWHEQNAIMEANQLFKRFNDTPNIIFGGKHNFIQRLKNKITKEEFDEKRLLPLNIQGECLKKGNRSFILDIIDNNQIIFKLNTKQHFNLELPNLRNNIKKQLYKLQELNEVKQGNHGYCYSIKLTDTHIYISFEEFKEQIHQYDEQRYIGIDLNPDTIGISIHENNKILHTQEFSLKLIFDKILSNNLSSDSKEIKYYQNKLQFETYEISKSISNLAKHYNCKTVFIEDLNFKSKLSKSQKYNNIGNRKNRNLWKRQLFVNNLVKRLNIFGIKLFTVNPAYSSFIGNLQYNYTDPINASIEIARRGYEYRINKNKDKFYPIIKLKDNLIHQWKEMVNIDTVKNWKDLFLIIKNLKLKYRVSLADCQRTFKVFRLNHTNTSCINIYNFS